MNHLLRGLVAAVAIAVPTSGGVLAATQAPLAVEDYQAALRASAGNAATCARIDNFARLTLTDAAPVFPLPLFEDDASSDLAAARDACLGALGKPAVNFDDKSGTPLLSPLNMEDPAKAYLAPNFPAGPAQPPL